MKINPKKIINKNIIDEETNLNNEYYYNLRFKKRSTKGLTYFSSILKTLIITSITLIALLTIYWIFYINLFIQKSKKNNKIIINNIITNKTITNEIKEKRKKRRK